MIDRRLDVSIVIINFNYARFLSAAIDSALAQVSPASEIIVVDDGSTDESAEIISRFGTSIRALFKENGGQASALNAGFSAATGDVVCLLDADDVILPTRVARVREAALKYPDASVICNQVKYIDASGVELERPASPRRMLNGNIRTLVEKSGGWWPHPASSGLAFSRKFLDAVAPIPEDRFRMCAEAYPVGLAPFKGDVAAVHEPLTFYRLHTGNWWNQDTADVANRRLEQVTLEFNEVQRALRDKLGLSSSASLGANFRYAQLRLATGAETSRLSVAAVTARSRTLPTSIKVREVAKTLLGK